MSSETPGRGTGDLAGLREDVPALFSELLALLRGQPVRGGQRGRDTVTTRVTERGAVTRFSLACGPQENF